MPTCPRPLWPRETADALMRQPWVGITGHHDRQVASDDPATHGPSDRYAFERLSAAHLEWLAALPAGVVLDEFHMPRPHISETGSPLAR